MVAKLSYMDNKESKKPSRNTPDMLLMPWWLCHVVGQIKHVFINICMLEKNITYHKRAAKGGKENKNRG